MKIKITQLNFEVCKAVGKINRHPTSPVFDNFERGYLEDVG
jgi:hypothetical protein